MARREKGTPWLLHQREQGGTEWADAGGGKSRLNFLYSLPRAVVSLKQGAGWLIRDENDRGVLILCDPRLLTRPYGRRI